MQWDPRSQGCIRVLTTAGERVAVGLVDVYRRADEIAAVWGDTPGEMVAQIEELLGWAYAAGEYPEDAEDWHDRVRARESLAPVADWLESHPGCWNLFDPEQPLGQNANLLPHLEAQGVGPAQIVFEQVGDYNQLFDFRHLHHRVPLPAGAAYRAMRVQHLFGIGMAAKIKAKAMGMPAAFGRLSDCRLRTRFRIIAVPADPGSTLGDLLRINLAPYDAEPGTPNLTWTEGRTRRPFARTGALEARPVDGPADLHTTLGRSIAMRGVTLPDGSAGVDRVLVGPGETLADLPAAYLQDAVTFALPEQDGKPGKTVFFRPSSARDLWRESHALYAAVAERAKGADLYGRIALLRGRRIHLWTVGLLNQQGKVLSWVAARFPYVPGREAELRTAAETASAICEYSAKALYAAASEAQRTAYQNPKPADRSAQVARFNAEPEMWGAASPLFYALMDDVASGTPAADVLPGFGKEIHDLAHTALVARLATMPRSGRGLETRALSEAAFRRSMTGAKAPHHLKEAAHG
ncbi:type I-E CRISPR-associated protein Cse1/CasA [Streptomyces sp. NPDC090085]|uniref:type I-E CRISPR-associated protein Cse1/CasA n=1 Tax=Streptomyces sp. NPDC090085 TaxID=3365943 RepID=UPI0037F91876